MHRIDSATTTNSFPTPDAVGTPGYFAHGNPGASIPYTVTTADWGNAVQEEIASVVEGAGITLSKTQHNQLFTALQSLTAKKLAADLSLYVSTAGNDSNNGLTSGTAFATLQHAWDYIAGSINMNGYNITVHVADGTYTGGVFMYFMPAGRYGTITFQGNPSSPSNVLINVTNSSCFTTNHGAAVSINGFKVQATGSVSDAGAALVSGLGAQLIFQNIIFGTCRNHILSAAGGYVQCGAAYTIAAGADTHVVAEFGGVCLLGGATVTLSGTPAFATAFAASVSCATIDVTSTTFTGSATGVRYSVNGNAVISTGSAGASFLPGNSAGSASNGGQYI